MHTRRFAHLVKLIGLINVRFAALIALAFFTLSQSILGDTSPGDEVSADEVSATEAKQAIERAVSFFHGEVSSYGGYVYRYSADLKKQEGEGQTDKNTVWVEPPGTPAVGMAYLNAYRQTKQPSLLAAARDAATCLIRGQLRSGGWASQIYADGPERTGHAYRVEPVRAKQRNTTTFDDNKSQSAMVFLMQLDSELRFGDATLHEAVLYALDATCKSQFTIGAWPQRYSKFPSLAPPIATSAVYPEAWPRTYDGKSYANYYTFNDNAIVDVIDTLLMASQIYDQKRYSDSARQGIEFVLKAQMPAPQPAWAQQYDRAFRPAWARKFEPPAISGAESQQIIEALLRWYPFTRDDAILKATDKAIRYFERSELPDGQIARFYELWSNRPLYFTRDYRLTYRDNDLPTHYAFQTSSRVLQLRKQHTALSNTAPKTLGASFPQRLQGRRIGIEATKSSAKIRSIIDQLDDRGAWPEPGRLVYHGTDDGTRGIISSATFARNLQQLARYAAKHER